MTNVATGQGHSLFLKSSGSLWAMGRDYEGQLGDDGSFNNSNLPEQIVDSNVTAIAAGRYHSLFLKNDGSLWAMGSSSSGQVGYSYYYSSPVPNRIVASNVTAIAAGGQHSLFIKSDGSLWALGGNSSGQFGNGNYITNAPYGTNRAEQVVASNVTVIAAGINHSLFLKSDGSLWAMGANWGGQLGDGTYAKTNRPEQIVASGVTTIAARDHSLFLKNDGSLWVMGNNQYGQLGDGTTNNSNLPKQIVASGVTAIAAGDSHSLFLKSDGSLWAMGYNTKGQLGDGTYTQINLPEQIVASNVTAIAAGGQHSLFIKSDGSLWGMGWNAYGELGDGTYNQTNRPKQIVVIPPPVITTQPTSQTNIAGATVMFIVTASSPLPMSYQWQKNGTNLFDGGNISGATTNTLTITGISVTDVASYLVVVTNASGSVITSNATLTVIYPPAITAQPTNFLVLAGTNVGFGVSLTGSASYFRYQWRLNSTNILNATNAGYVIASVGTNHAGYYSVVVTNAAGGVTSSNAALSVVVSPASRTNFASSAATFNITAVGPASFTYQWQKNGTNLVDGGKISGTTNSTLTIANVVDADAADYSAVVSNATDSVTTSNATLTVEDSLFFAAHPLSQTVGLGSNVTFNATGYGAPPLIFQWYFSNAPVGSPTAGTNVSAYSLTNVQTNQAGTYSVQVINGAGNLMSSNATLTVVLPPAISTQPTNSTKSATSNATFTVTASSALPMSYQWQKNGTNLVNGGNISGATTNTLTVTTVSDADVAAYKVVVSHAYGSVMSSNAALTVINPPVITGQPVSQQPLLGSGISFTVALSGTSPFQYQWRFNGTNILAGTNATYTITAVAVTNNGSYSVTVTNSAGGVISSNAVLEVIVPPTVALQILAGYPFLGLNGMLSSNFNVQYITNLTATNWLNLLSITNLSVTPYQFLDPAGNIPPARFYRAVMQ